MPVGESSSFGKFFWVLAIAGGVAAAAYGGLIVLPPYMANRAVKDAVAQVLSKISPDVDDTTLMGQINQVLSNSHVSHYWIDDSGPHQDEYLRLTTDDVTINHDDDQLSVDVSYTQQLWVPIIGREKDFTYNFHVDAPSH